jgi:hypothetical protein
VREQQGQQALTFLRNIPGTNGGNGYGRRHDRLTGHAGTPHRPQTVTSPAPMPRDPTGGHHEDQSGHHSPLRTTKFAEEPPFVTATGHFLMSLDNRAADSPAAPSAPLPTDQA